MDTAEATAGFLMNQTMLRVKDPERATAFYRDVPGMQLLDRCDFDELGVPFVKRPSDGKMKGLAFIKDPASVGRSMASPDGQEAGRSKN